MDYHILRSDKTLLFANNKLVEIFLSMQRVLNPNFSIEIGAHEASFSQSMIRHFVDIPCWAFEANPSVHQKFYGKLTALGIDYLNLAISDINGAISFEIQESHLGDYRPDDLANNSIYKRTESGWTYKQIAVASRSLDDFFFNPQKLSEHSRGCLWVDVEGASREVLNGGTSLLNKIDSIFIEVEHQMHWENQWLFADVNEFFRQHGFVAVARDSEYESIGQNNVIYIQSNTEQFDEIVGLFP